MSGIGHTRFIYDDDGKQIGVVPKAPAIAWIKRMSVLSKLYCFVR